MSCRTQEISGRRWIVLDPDEGRRGSSWAGQPVGCSLPEQIRDAVGQATPQSLWLSFCSKMTDELLRAANDYFSTRRGHSLRIGNIFMLEPPRERALPVLRSFFGKVIGEAAFKTLPLDELAEVLSSPEKEVCDLFVAGLVDTRSGALALVRGNLDSIIVPLSAFGRSGTSKPNFRNFGLGDFGHTIRFGGYEVAADFVLYEVDPDYRTRINAKRRAEERGFGPSLRRLRIQRGLPRAGFSGVAAKTIARIELGETGKPRGETLRIICDTLGVRRSEIESY